jgi:hypothetical protein
VLDEDAGVGELAQRAVRRLQRDRQLVCDDRTRQDEVPWQEVEHAPGGGVAPQPAPPVPRRG